MDSLGTCTSALILGIFQAPFVAFFLYRRKNVAPSSVARALLTCHLPSVVALNAVLPILIIVLQSAVMRVLGNQPGVEVFNTIAMYVSMFCLIGVFTPLLDIYLFMRIGRLQMSFRDAMVLFGFNVLAIALYSFSPFAPAVMLPGP